VRFSRTAKLRFQTYVYNAALSGAAPVIGMQLEFRREGQMLIQTPPIPVATQGVKDLARIPVVGEFPLQEFPTGRYELTVIVTDQSTKKSASQQVKFVIE
jgi:hypothetical protein